MCIQQIHNKTGMDDTEVMGLEGLGRSLREYVWLSMRRRGSSCSTIAAGALVRASRFCTAARRVSGARETLVTIPGGAKANGRGGPAAARHPSSIRKRESATRGTRRFRVEGTVWRLRRPHFRTGGYCSLDFENTGLIAKFRDT
jgi:hypothetical protein